MEFDTSPFREVDKLSNQKTNSSTPFHVFIMEPGGLCSVPTVPFITIVNAIILLPTSAFV